MIMLASVRGYLTMVRNWRDGGVSYRTCLRTDPGEATLMTVFSMGFKGFVMVVMGQSVPVFAF